MRIEGSGAIVAGGASGLGEATARALHERGAQVTIADLNAEKGEALARELGERAAFVPCDVTDEEQVARRGRAGRARRRLAHQRLLRGRRLGRAHRLQERPAPAAAVRDRAAHEPDRDLQRAAPGRRRDERARAAGDGERGVCVNTASIAAFDGQIGQIAYSASKGGIVGLTLPAARDMASRGIRVVTIAPGTFDTPLLGALPQEARDELGQAIPFPSAARRSRRVRGARGAHRREPDAERRDDPARRRAADASRTLVPDCASYARRWEPHPRAGERSTPPISASPEEHHDGPFGARLALHDPCDPSCVLPTSRSGSLLLAQSTLAAGGAKASAFLFLQLDHQRRALANQSGAAPGSSPALAYLFVYITLLDVVELVHPLA